MSYGLRVWDTSGNLTLDITDRLTRFVSSTVVSFTTTSPESDKYVYVTGLTNDGKWFVSSSTFMVKTAIEPGRVAVRKLHRSSTASSTITVFKI